MVDRTNAFIRFFQAVAVLVGIGLVWFLFVTYGKDIPTNEWLFPGDPVIRVGGIPIKVEIVKTREERMQGLSGRETLEDGRGMLFVFPEADYHAMWMKGMNFPIDIIWIGEDFTIIDMHNNLMPDSYPRTFRPKAPAKYAIEVNMLHLETFGGQEGARVEIPDRYLNE